MLKPISSKWTTPRWRALVYVLAGALLGVLLVLPYQLSLMPLPADLPISLPVLVAIALLQNGMLLGCLIAAGLWLGAKVGLGFPGLEQWLAGQRHDPARRHRLGQAVLIGSLVGLVILGVAQLAQPLLPAPRSTVGEPSWWQGLLASVYGGLTEEVLLRLGLMTLLVFGLSRVWRTSSGQPPAAVYWISVVLAALLFGAGHLPLAAGIYGLSPAVIAYVLIGNGIGGLVFGWLYWRRGLGSAITAHFSADIVLHVLSIAIAQLLRG